MFLHKKKHFSKIVISCSTRVSYLSILKDRTEEDILNLPKENLLIKKERRLMIIFLVN